MPPPEMVVTCGRMDQWGLVDPTALMAEKDRWIGAILQVAGWVVKIFEVGRWAVGPARETGGVSAAGGWGFVEVEHRQGS